MRMVFIGAGKVAVASARLLLKRGHEVVIIERQKTIIDDLAEQLDCGFIHGDGSTPDILREADPEHTDLLFCITGSDQANIIGSLVGRSMGFKRVVTKIDDPTFEHICLELGLEDTIIPTRTFALLLADMSEGRDPLALSTMIRDEARAWSFVAGSEQVKPISELGLGDDARVICIYRDDHLILPESDTRLKAGDEVVLITYRDKLKAIEERFKPDN